MLSLIDLLTRISSGALTPEAALDLSRQAIAAREREVGAFAHLAPFGPAGTGPLAGIAVGVKDIMDTADMPTGMGSAIYDGWRPRADAAVVATLRRAGATIVGKTTTTAFASSDPTATRNPHDLAHTPGGSSAGSAAAVAAGMTPLALGTQTGGSVIRPASFCGVAAIKPSFRLIPTVGVKCYSWTLDTVGLFAAGVADLAVGLEHLAGRRMAADGGGPFRIGLCTQVFAGEPEPDGIAAFEHATAALSRAGATLSDAPVPTAIAEAWAAHGAIQDFEAAAALGWEYDTYREALAPKIRANLDAGRAIGADAYDDARRVANRARQDARDLFAGFDAILTHAAPGAAPHGLESTGDPRYNRVWTLLGTPCVSVPGHRTPAGLPIGIQVVAPFAQDARALAVAAFVERALAAGRA